MIHSWNNVIFHIDMDSFFASVESSKRPELKGLPLVIGSDPKSGSGRGVVSTCSYEARRFGIHSAMPISKAYRLCPDAVFLPVNSKLYKEVSDRIMRILQSYADRFEQVSIDEAYLDMSSKVCDHTTATKFATQIKNKVVETEGITCSVGVAPGKTVAKIASDHDKPNGLTIVQPTEVKQFLAPLPVAKIPGIGKKTEQILKQMHIKDIGELADADIQILMNKFGKHAISMKSIANGIDVRELKDKTEVKSISKEDTFDFDTNDVDKIDSVLMSLCEDVHRTMLRKQFLFRTVTIKVRFKDFTTYTRASTLPFTTNDLETIKKCSRDLMQEFIHKDEFRLIGVGITKLEKIDRKQTLITDFI
ncbi:DNA polymerase IV [Methanosalsum natronophilum]|uniref:DNA polymerase IV n=1 Tax=Methanosalsum natronophilum TaxID=768733 RepID=A0A3R7X797_9EURY|nr:MAG: DNA polymerase IV [Methanosalsum natronophilum]